MKQNILRIFSFIGACSVFVVIYAYTTDGQLGSYTSEQFDSIEGHSIVTEEGGVLPQNIEVVRLEKAYVFANEEVPIGNFDVQERLIKELTINSYFHSSTSQAILRSGRYFPIMREILLNENVSQDFLYLAVAESNLENVTSPAGAKGFWQFMPATASAYGLEISSYVDERYHIEKSTIAACHLLKDYKERFGTWTMAATAYNAGETRMASNIEEQLTDDFYEMNLNAETNRYIFRILAMKTILTDPKKFGFHIPPKDRLAPLPPYKEVLVEESIESLGEFAKEHETTYRLLKVYNPWLVNNKLPVGYGKSYLIRIPL